jgi:acyl-coenzyme A synthetase/AMP-(fatty) acid ligase
MKQTPHFFGTCQDLEDDINSLTDGVLTCTYAGLPAIFEQIQRYIEEQSISQEGCIAFECDNSLPSALFLLFLLEKGYSFLLLPRQLSMAQADRLVVPRFCHYKAHTESARGDGKVVDLHYPKQYLRLEKNEDSLVVHPLSANGPKIYLQTSGSTGNPKIVMHSHARLKSNALNCVKRLNISGKDRIAIPVPIFHMYGLGAAFLPGVIARASIDLQKGANLLRYFEREQEFEPNTTFLTPAYCNALAKVHRSGRSYRLTVAAGDRITDDVFINYESRSGCLVKLYGSTEMGAIAAANPRDPSDVRIKTVGKPMPGVQINVEKRSGKMLEEVQDSGILWCKNEYGFEGYVDTNGNLSLPFNKNNWFCTNDLGLAWEDGHVVVIGRSDQSVNRDGLLVSLKYVEEMMLSIQGIEAVTVVSKGESQRGKGIVACCVVSQVAAITEEDIRLACFEKLPNRAVPDKILFIRSFPLLANGKVDRQKLINSIDDSFSQGHSALGHVPSSGVKPQAGMP